MKQYGLSETPEVGQTVDDRTIHSGRPRRKAGRYVVVAGLACLVLLLALGAIGIATNRLAVIVKSPDSRISITENVCDERVINEYNTVMARYDDGYSDAVTLMQSVVDKFSKQSNYKNDPNCIHIEFELAVLKSDKAAASASVNRMSALISQGRHADLRLRGVADIDEMRSTIASMSPTEEDVDD